MKIILLIVLLVMTLTSYAQPTKFLRVRNGQDVTKYVPPQDRFQFQNFQNGKLYFINGKYAQARMNYCYLRGEVMYIDPKGDTLLIADNNRVNYAEMGKFIFHCDPGNGYMEVVEDCGIVMLTKKHQYKMIGIEKKGAYNNKNEQGSVSNTTSYTDPISGVTTALPVNNNVVLRPDLSYFFIDINRRSHKADKHSLLKIFSKNRNAVEKYLKTEHINFEKEEDLRRIIRYCSELELTKS